MPEDRSTRPKPALLIRTLIVAASAAAATFALLPGTATPQAPAGPGAASASVVITRDVQPLAAHTPAAGAARNAALQNALSRLGAPYRWGAAGPSAFDCSGLVVWAFGTAGVPLPRTSRAQSTVGTPVAKSDLRPGDLVFFYRPVSHVAIYVGEGKVVHASTAGQPVKISDIDRMPFSGARRV
ncbi:C40 family peptidase [Pseudonocardia hispaniensis]|uniref:C40 family peptidase n=1 Tax=Pseudonocardia hispaniensis TaxID=904933 RepID=A0ABW1J6W1_9PSEU